MNSKSRKPLACILSLLAFFLLQAAAIPIQYFAAVPQASAADKLDLNTATKDQLKALLASVTCIHRKLLMAAPTARNSI